ncbi:MAG: hypothetical protein WCL04_02275 [Verrucomicrobiota bacterium]
MKAYFLSRQLREKLLIIGLVAAGLAVWANHLWAANREYRADDLKQTATRKIQEDVLNRADAINAEQRAIVTKLDPAKSIRDETSFDIAITQLAQQVPGVTAQSGKVTFARGTQIALLTKDVTFRDLDPNMAELIPLYVKLMEKAPYINITKTSITLNNNNGGGRGQRGTGPNATPGGGPNNFNTGQPGAGVRGGRGQNTQPGSIGPLDVATAATNPRGVRGGLNPTQTLQPTGPRLNVTFTLTAISIVAPGTNPPRPGGTVAPAPRTGAPAAGARSG